MQNVIAFSICLFVPKPVDYFLAVGKVRCLVNRHKYLKHSWLHFQVTHDTHKYVDDIEEREEGGTPAIVESIRAGLVFQLKEVCETFSRRVLENSSMNFNRIFIV